MKNILTVLFVLILNFSLGQTYVIKGILTFPNLPETGKVYYEYNAIPTKEKFVTFNSEHKFEITITQEDIRTDSIIKLYFTDDLDSKWPCYYKINIDSIQLSLLFTKNQTIELHAHHNHFLDCDITAIESAESNRVGAYIGNYTFIKNGLEYELELMDHYYGKISFPLLDKQYMNVGHSSWAYDANSKTLSIQGHGRANNSFGLYIKEDWELKFKVQKKLNKLVFKSLSGKSNSLVKN
ncbi:MAG: hypothetical protein ACI8ZM_000121 [Crocinitomix sp.]|jgi:hypothetical protein